MKKAPNHLFGEGIVDYYQWNGKKFNLNLLLDCVEKGELCDSPSGHGNCCKAGSSCTQDRPSGAPYYGRASGFSYCR